MNSCVKSNRKFVYLSYVFEIYQTTPNMSINNGLMLPEKNSLTSTCAAWGEWSPKEIPRCIRK